MLFLVDFVVEFKLNINKLFERIYTARSSTLAFTDALCRLCRLCRLCTHWTVLMKKKKEKENTLTDFSTSQRWRWFCCVCHSRMMVKVTTFNKLRSTVVGHLFKQFRSLFTLPSGGIATAFAMFSVYEIYVLLVEKLKAQINCIFAELQQPRAWELVLKSINIEARCRICFTAFRTDCEYIVVLFAIKQVFRKVRP